MISRSKDFRILEFGCFVRELYILPWYREAHGLQGGRDGVDICESI